MIHLRSPEPLRNTYLELYLQQLYAASGGGWELTERSSRSQSDPEACHELTALAAELAEDRAALLGILVELGVDRSPVKERLVSWTETLGRLKPNGTLIRRSPLSDVLELEGIAAALQLKRHGWSTLRGLTDVQERLNPYQLDLLLRRAQDQEDRLESLRTRIARQALSHRPASSAGA